MKRIVTLLLAAGLVMGAYTGAQAADVKVSGKWNFGFHFMNDANHGEGSDDFNASQRLRLQMDIIASENLKGVIFFEMGNSTWGAAGQADLGADDHTVEVKRSYIDWTIPSTEATVRMGIQGLTLPGTFGSALFDDDVAGITISNAFNDNFALTAFWARPFDGEDVWEDGDSTKAPSKTNGNAAYNDEYNYHDEMDVFGLVAPITLDGHKITPYFVYSQIGKDTLVDGITDNANWGSAGKYKGTILTEDVDAFWFGVAYSMSAFDPFTFDASFLYGSADGGKEVDQDGWMIDFKAAYALDFMTPGILGWYATGDDKNDQGILPTFGAGCWYPTSFGFVGSCYQVDTHISEAPEGTWGIGLELADISFIEDLSHVFRFVYMEGTNEAGADPVSKLTSYASYRLSDEDSAIEINFDTKYDIYENLAFILELGYIDFDMENGDGKSINDDAAYKATFNFVYSF